MNYKDALSGAWSYPAFVVWMEELVNNEKTSGILQSAERVKFTRLNLHRMKRIYKTGRIDPLLAEMLRNQTKSTTWLVLTEAWCGDAAQNIPLVARMAELSEKIELKLILRDEHPAIMNSHLTNGSRSIPILICLDHNLNETGSWGPRPEPAQQMLVEYRKNGKESYESFQDKLHSWYASDKTNTLQQEFKILLKA